MTLSEWSMSIFNIREFFISCTPWKWPDPHIFLPYYMCLFEKDIYFESKGFHLWNLLVCMSKLCLVGQMYFVSPDSFTVEPCYEKKLLIGSSDPVTNKYI